MHRGSRATWAGISSWGQWPARGYAMTCASGSASVQRASWAGRKGGVGEPERPAWGGRPAGRDGAPERVEPGARREERPRERPEHPLARVRLGEPVQVLTVIAGVSFFRSPKARGHDHARREIEAAIEKPASRLPAIRTSSLHVAVTGEAPHPGLSTTTPPRPRLERQTGNPMGPPKSWTTSVKRSSPRCSTKAAKFVRVGLGRVGRHRADGRRDRSPGGRGRCSGGSGGARGSGGATRTTRWAFRGRRRAVPRAPRRRSASARRGGRTSDRRTGTSAGRRRRGTRRGPGGLHAPRHLHSAAPERRNPGPLVPRPPRQRKFAPGSDQPRSRARGPA